MGMQWFTCALCSPSCRHEAATRRGGGVRLAKLDRAVRETYGIQSSAVDSLPWRVCERHHQVAASWDAAAQGATSLD